MPPADLRRYMEELWRLRPTEGSRTVENVVVVERVDSTNRLARTVAAEYEEEGRSVRSLLVLALEQTGGRGRRGRSWSSPHGKGVYATRVVAVSDPERLQTLPLLVGVALSRALSRHLPSPALLKWPNDLLVQEGTGRKKIGGILIEAMIRPGEGGVALMGFGINVGQEAADLPAGATSIHLEGGSDEGLAGLAALTWDLVTAIEEELAHLGDTAYAVERYREASIHREGEPIACRVADEVIEGTFAGFDEQGHLRLRPARGGEEMRISAGEVIEP
jgi:BirA family biotin operon repressor/biotin-[acetyl-CoA-carboxylase] ligase